MLNYLLYLYTYRQVHAGDEAGYLLECERLSNRINQITGEDNHGSAVDAAFRKFEAIRNNEGVQRSVFCVTQAMVEFYYDAFHNNCYGNRTWDNEEDLQFLRNRLNIDPNTNI